MEITKYPTGVRFIVYDEKNKKKGRYSVRVNTSQLEKKKIERMESNDYEELKLKAKELYLKYPPLQNGRKQLTHFRKALYNAAKSIYRSSGMVKANKENVNSKKTPNVEIPNTNEKEEKKSDDDDDKEEQEEGEDISNRYSIQWYNSSNIGVNDPDFPAESIFSVDPNTANTKVFFAPSRSGKTTLMVRELNKLVRNSKKNFDPEEGIKKIVLFTESTNAQPLKHLDKILKDGTIMTIYDRFVPRILHFLTHLNSITDNKYRFLLILDDVLNLRSSDMVKSILTLRNCGISTCIVIQYIKLIAPSQRHSIHDYYVFNLTLPDWEYFIKEFAGDLIRTYMEEELGDPNSHKYTPFDIARRMRSRLEDRILHYSQVENKIAIYKKPEFYSKG